MHQAITTAQFIYDLIGRGNPLGVILSAISTMVEEQFPDAMVSVMLYSAQNRTLSLVAGDAFSQNYQQAMRDMQIGPEVGSCGAAAYLRKIVVCEDLLNDSRWVGFIDLVRSEKIAACWSAPIISPLVNYWEPSPPITDTVNRQNCLKSPLSAKRPALPPLR